MNINVARLDGFLKSLLPCVLDKSSISIRRVNPGEHEHNGLVVLLVGI